MADRAAQILRARRLELGMTQEEVAIQLGMSLHQYQRYEYGEHQIALFNTCKSAVFEKELAIFLLLSHI